MSATVVSRVSNAKDTATVEKGPAAVTAAEQAAAQRAYPADEVSLAATLDAQKAWGSVANRKGRNKPGAWSLIGPEHANMPGTLVFSGADYTTSGRITALALDPSCSVSKCRLWVGAAGGGVWRTTNALGGTPKWTPVSDGLPTNAIGALAYDPRSDTLYAGTGEPNASADSEAGLGLFKSTDGGDTWKELTHNDGFPKGTIGKIGVTVSANHDRVWAIVEADSGGVFRSEDGGETWRRTNDERNLRQRAWYYSHIHADPKDPETVYVLNTSLYRSVDGGRTFTQLRAPHGDHHALWIAPDCTVHDVLRSGGVMPRSRIDDLDLLTRLEHGLHFIDGYRRQIGELRLHKRPGRLDGDGVLITPLGRIPVDIAHERRNIGGKPHSTALMGSHCRALRTGQGASFYSPRQASEHQPS